MASTLAAALAGPCKGGPRAACARVATSGSVAMDSLHWVAAPNGRFPVQNLLRLALPTPTGGPEHRSANVQLSCICIACVHVCVCVLTFGAWRLAVLRRSASAGLNSLCCQTANWAQGAPMQAEHQAGPLASRHQDRPNCVIFVRRAAAMLDSCQRASRSSNAGFLSTSWRDQCGKLSHLGGAHCRQRSGGRPSKLRSPKRSHLGGTPSNREP